MIMSQHILSIFIGIPLVGFLISLLVKPTGEKTLAHLVFYAVLLHFLVLVPFSLHWLFNGHQIIDEREQLSE
jgi:hypothetical protein